MSMNTSAYVTPLNQSIDETTSISADSVYVTPDVSTFLADLSLSPNFVEETKNTSLRNDSSFLNHKTRGIRKNVSSKLFVDKENLGASPFPKKLARRKSESTPLKCVTNITSPILNVLDVVVSSPFKTVNSISDIKNSHEKRSVKRKQFLPRIGFFSKNKLSQQVLKSSRIPAISLNADNDAIVIRIPNKNCGTVYCDIENDEDKVETPDLSILTQPDVRGDFSIEEESCLPILQNNEIIKKNVFQTSWTTLIRRPITSIFKKIRVSPVKRLLSRSVRGIHSCYERYLARKPRINYETLESAVGNDPKTNENTFSEDIVKFLTTELEPLKNAGIAVNNIEKFMEQMMNKLNVVENEMKELRHLVKNNCISRPTEILPPPLPPPPPPPPPPFPMLNSITQNSTPKRKADLTTPEYNQVAKRPHAQEQRTQFSITVEDLRNVKLRKTGNRIIKRKSSTNTDGISMSATTRSIRTSRFAKRDLSEIAAELLSPRKSEKLSESSSLSSPNTTTTDSVGYSNTALNLFDQTPKTKSRYLNSTLRSGKRKDWSGESPRRKRLNSTSCSSPKRHGSLTDSFV